MRPIYIIRWSGAVGGNAVHVVLHSLMLQGIDNDISGPLLMVRTLGNSVGVAIPQPRVAGEARYPGYAPPLTLLLCKSCD